ncbi:MAG: ribulokinase, partial [Lachnospiraceae bacterium]|nr:ribulokinase [Lachnospiraceae bacterium]
LDYGTLSGRAVLVRCRDGKNLAEAVRMYSHGVIEEVMPDGKTCLPVNWCLEAPSDYVEVLDTVIPEVIQKSGIDPVNIIGTGADFTSCTVLPVDAEGNALCERPEFASRRNAWAKLWKHHGAQKMADKVNLQLEAQGLLEDVRFGGRVSPELMVPKVMETLQEDPEIYEAADEFLEAGDWITRLLTGSHDRSCSMAGYKMWWNKEQGYPLPEFFRDLDGRMTDFTKDKLPGKICSMGDRIGTLSAEWAKRLGLPEGIAVSPTIIDSHAGFAGSGAASPKQMLLVLGTSSVLAALSDRPFSGKGVLGGVKSAIVPGYYAYESGLASVGDLFGWFVDQCVPAAYEEEAKGRSLNIHTLLSEKAKKLKVGQSGLLALEWWNGNKTPHVNGELAGCLIGMKLTTKPEEIYRALVEATAFNTRNILDIYEENGVKVDEIIASGGIAAKNPFLMQIYADVLGKKLRVADSGQAAALGSAIYAALAAGSKNGGYDTYSDAVIHMTRLTDKVYFPQKENQEKYLKLYEIYCRFSEVMGASESRLMQELHVFQQGE